MKHYLLPILAIAFLSKSFAQSQKEVLPSKSQLEWADAEIGAIYHLDMQVFEPDYEFRSNWDYQPDLKIFNPKELDTDQWIRSAKDAGATYAVLVAKHCSGFSLWPTKAHEYNIKNTPWKNGKGDIVKEFIASCKKYGIKPGLYASSSVNAYMKVDNPGKPVSRKAEDLEKYQKVVKTQLTELWTQYGKLFEIWFDGGVLPEKEGGINMLPLIQKYQPEAAAFQGPYGYRNNIRWVGNESGVAPYPCWSRADSTTSASGVVEIKGLNGDPNGGFWCPGEADFPLRVYDYQGGWFWKKGEDPKLRSLADLRNRYNETVGRNTNILLGIVVDDRGLVPDVDVERLREFGDDLKKRFSKPLGATSGQSKELIIKLNAPQKIHDIVIQEDLAKGERIREYKIYGKKGAAWQLLAEGTSVGHKRIETVSSPTTFSELKLEIVKSAGDPAIRRFACY